MTEKLDKIKSKIKELRTEISKAENEAFEIYDEIHKDIDWDYHYDQIYFSSNTENDTRGQDITYLKEIKDGIFINYDDNTYKYFEKPSKERFELVKDRIHNKILYKFMRENEDTLEWNYWKSKIIRDL